MNTAVTKRLGILPQIASLEIPAAWTRVFGVVSFAAMLALGAHVKFFLPGNPVPVTLQTLFVLLAGALMGPWAGLSAVALYIAAGTCGVPLFASAGASGWLYLAGPTGGYLAGFMLATVLIGLVAQRTNKTAVLFSAFAAGSALILLCGMLGLTTFMHLPFKQAWMLGVLPFLAGDALKAATALTLCVILRRR